MNILVFSLTFDPFVGGAEIALKEIAYRLPEVRFDLVTLRFNSNLPKLEQMGNIYVHRIGFARRNPAPASLLTFPLYLNKVFYPFTAAAKALALMRGRKYDFMWSIMSYMAFPAYFVSLVRPAMPYVVTLQDGDTIEHITDRWRVRPFKWLLKKSFRGAARMQAISRFLAEFARNMGYAGEIAVIPNGVDIALFGKKHKQTEIQALRRDLENELGEAEYEGTAEPSTDTMLVTVSRLVRKNGVDLLINAMELLPKNVKLLILGNGPDLLQLKTLVSQYGLDNRVLFAGHVSYEEIPKYLAAADIFVRPSRSEGFGNAFVEAMAAGLPVVATPVGGITDFIIDPDANPGMEPTGVLCAPEDPASIAEKVKMLIDEPELRKLIVENGRKLAFAHYDWRLIAERMREEVFSAMVKSA